MNKIVSHRSRPFIQQIATHRNVGNEKEQSKPKPTAMQMLVKNTSDEQESSVFNTEE